jgi:hypothetical protein
MIERPLVILHAHQQVVARDAGIVDQNVDSTMARQDALDGGIDLRRIGDIQHQTFAAQAGFDQLRANRLGAGVTGRRSDYPDNRPWPAYAGWLCRFRAKRRSPVRHVVACSFLLVFRIQARVFASTSASAAASASATPGKPSTMRLLRPASTLPGPHSATNWIPWSAKARTVSTQRTGLYNCRARASRMASGATWLETSALCRQGFAGDRDFRQRSAQPIGGRFHQGAMRRHRHRQRQRPLGAAFLGENTAARHRRLVAGNHHLPGRIEIDRFQHFTLRRIGTHRAHRVIVQSQHRRHRAAPSGTAVCIASARKRTSRMASPKSSAPAQTRAVYSPRLWPAMMAGAAPP